MTQATPYDRQTSFALFSAENPGSQQSGVDLDGEFNAVKVSLDDTQANLALIQADDGTLRAGTVGLAQLDESVSIGVHSKGVWVAAKSYTANTDTVFNTTKIYLCLVTHTSGVFATDLAAGKWLQIADLGVQVLDVNTVATANLQDASVSTAKLQGAAVTTTVLANGAVDLTKLAASLQAYLVPAGVIEAYAGVTPPTGWLFANGQSVLRATYPALFTAIGTAYGFADGTHFNVPNVCGRQIVGMDGAGGVALNHFITVGKNGIDGSVTGATGGAESHTLSIGQLPVVTPAGAVSTITPAGTIVTTIVNQPAGGVITSEAGVQIGGGGTGGVKVLTATSAFTGTPVTPGFAGVSFGGGQDHGTLDPSIVFPYIVKAH